ITTGGFYFKSADDASAFTSTGATVFGTNGTAATSALTSIDWTNAAGAALTVTYNGISSRTEPLGVQIYFSVAMNDGSIVTLNAGNNGTQWITNEYDVTEIRYTTTYLDALTIYDGYATADQAWELNKGVLPSIPEPATATLSLLALAGLAARRRRK
ncbi:MAG: PEP-CTERM sorting domain-containing protein, partial [Akkermansia sp.]|nr:PEP-CTERM sorting domain-containing protein [Akkermansia sp.]